jgi:hypothetical protein
MLVVSLRATAPYKRQIGRQLGSDPLRLDGGPCLTAHRNRAICTMGGQSEL